MQTYSNEEKRRYNKKSVKNVLSLFDGISCGQVALMRAGITFENYYASEVNEDSISVAKKNFPNTKHIGSIVDVKAEDLPKIDMIIGGSPCQGLSLAGEHGRLEDDRSSLFYEFVRLIQECKPKYWLLENVMTDIDTLAIMNEQLGTTPISINSNLVSAQNRTRLYWSNFDFAQPIDQQVFLKDIVEKPLSFKNFEGTSETFFPSAIRTRKFNGKSQPCLEVRAVDIGKANCLSKAAKDSCLTTLKPGKYGQGFSQPYRYFTEKEYCRLQTLPDDYFKDTGLGITKIRELVADAWTVDVIKHILKHI